MEEENKSKQNPALMKLLTDKNQIPSNSIDKITDKIYLGEMDGLDDHNYFSKEKITHIISLIDIKIDNLKDLNITQKSIVDIEDTDNAKLYKYFKECIEFIESADKIFIHCMCGVSRSPSIVIAYLMWKTCCSLDDTYAFVLSRRIYIGPNDGFMEQLKFFDKLLKEKNYNLNEIDSGAFASGEKKENV